MKPVIAYARVSSNNPDQMLSLGNQITQLKKSNNIVITHIGSGGNGLPEKLKEEILHTYDMYGHVLLQVIAIDRLTRNIADIDFLKKYVGYIYVNDEDKTYEMKTEWDLVLHKIIDAVKELDTIKIRSIRNHENEKNDDEKNDIVVSQRCFMNMQQKCDTNHIVLQRCNIAEDIIIKLEKFIRDSQNLDNLKSWEKFFTQMNILKLDVNNERNLYRNCLATYNQNSRKRMREDEKYEIEFKDVYDYVVNILRIHNYNCDENILKEFVKCNILFGKRSNNELIVEHIIQLTRNLYITNEDIKTIRKIICRHR